MEEEFPLLWTSSGAAEDIQPVGFINRMKWSLLRRWFAPERTINKRLYSSLSNADDADLGAVDRLKRYLLIRWLPGIRGETSDAMALAELGSNSDRRHSLYSNHEDAMTINALAKMSTPLAVAEAEPTALLQLSTVGLQPLGSRRMSGSPRHSEERPSSRGSSGMMFEERNLSDSESDAEHVHTAEGGAER